MLMPVMDIRGMRMLMFQRLMAMLMRVGAVHQWGLLLMGMNMMLISM